MQSQSQIVAEDSFKKDEVVLELEQKVRDAFVEQRLVKGYTQVLTAINLHRDLQIYCAGPLDATYEEGLNQTLKGIENPRNTVHHLPASCKRLVYDAIRDVPNKKKKSSDKPRKFFNTRVFGIIG